MTGGDGELDMLSQRPCTLTIETEQSSITKSDARMIRRFGLTTHSELAKFGRLT